MSVRIQVGWADYPIVATAIITFFGPFTLYAKDLYPRGLYPKGLFP